MKNIPKYKKSILYEYKLLGSFYLFELKFTVINTTKMNPIPFVSKMS